MTKLLKLILFFLAITLLGFTTAQSEDRVVFDFVRTPKSCDHECVQGACSYSSCGKDRDPVTCPGGACRFERCVNPVCSGGGCEFVRCVGGSCDGGGCNFIEPQTTLKAGYCDGESCTLNGKDHPSLRHYLTV